MNSQGMEKPTHMCTHIMSSNYLLLFFFGILNEDIHVIFSWTQIGKFGFSDREIGVSNREIFSRQKIFNFSVKNCYLQHRRSL